MLGRRKAPGAARGPKSLSSEFIWATVCEGEAERRIDGGQTEQIRVHIACWVRTVERFDSSGLARILKGRL